MRPSHRWHLLCWRSRDVDGHGRPCEPDAHACSLSLCTVHAANPCRPLALSDPPSHPLQAINMANRLQSAGNNDASSAQDPDASEACARAVSDASTVPQAGAPASTGGAPSAAVVPSLFLGSQEEPGGGGHMIKPRNTVGNQQRNTTKQRNTKFDDDPMAC